MTNFDHTVDCVIGLLFLWYVEDDFACSQFMWVRLSDQFAQLTDWQGDMQGDMTTLQAQYYRLELGLDLVTNETWDEPLKTW